MIYHGLLLWCLPGFFLAYVMLHYPLEIIEMLGGWEDMPRPRERPPSLEAVLVFIIVAWPLVLLALLVAPYLREWEKEDKDAR